MRALPRNASRGSNPAGAVAVRRTGDALADRTAEGAGGRDPRRGERARRRARRSTRPARASRCTAVSSRIAAPTTLPGRKQPLVGRRALSPAPRQPDEREEQHQRRRARRT